MPKCYFQTTFMKPNNPEAREPMLSLNVTGFLSSERVVFHLIVSSPMSPGELCPRSHEATLRIPLAHCRHLQDRDPIFTLFIFFMPVPFYYIYLKHSTREGNQHFHFSHILPNQLLSEVVIRVPASETAEPHSHSTSPPAGLSLWAHQVDPWDRVEFHFSRLV